MKTLSPRQAIFVESYLASGNLKKAERDAGYSDGAGKIALNSKHVRMAIENAQREIFKNLGINKEKVLTEMWLCAMSPSATPAERFKMLDTFGQRLGLLNSKPEIEITVKSYAFDPDALILEHGWGSSSEADQAIQTVRDASEAFYVPGGLDRVLGPGSNGEDESDSGEV